MPSRFLILAILAALIGAQSARAQNGPSPAENLLRERTQELERQRLEEERVPLVLETSRPPAPGEEQVCFPISDIQLTGVSVLSAKKVNAALKPYARNCMGQKSIEASIAAINNLYIQEGYITSRAFIPPQNLTTGILQIVVVEGFIQALAFKSDTEDLPQKAVERKMRFAFPSTVGDKLNLRDLEQGLDQMSRLPSDNPSMDLQPGNVPGGSVVVVKSASVDRFRGIIGTDNRGSGSATRIRLGFEVDDMLRMNDLFSFFLVGDATSNNAVASFSIPYGRWTFALNGTYSDSVSALTDASDLTSFSSSLALTGDYLLGRDQNNKSWASLRLGKRWAQRYVNESELTPQNTTTFRLGYRREVRVEKQTRVFNIGLTGGGPFLGGSSNVEGTDYRTPKPEFFALDGSFTLVRPLGQKVSLYSTTRAQISGSGALLSDDQFGVGGWDTVRGYAGVGLSTDSGIVMRNEFNFPMPEFCGVLCKKLQGKAQPYAFVDAGYGKNIDTQDSISIAGGGIGIRYNHNRLTAELALGIPLILTEERDNYAPDLLFNMTWKLF